MKKRKNLSKQTLIQQKGRRKCRGKIRGQERQPSFFNPRFAQKLRERETAEKYTKRLQDLQQCR